MACPTIRTTNDMPIVPVASLTALGLVPFQINPHFTDAMPPELMVETRRDRIAQFLERSATPVLGLHEGAWLHVHGDTRTVGGDNGAVMFTRDGTVELTHGDCVDPWWQPPVFDDWAPTLTVRR